MRRVQVQQAAFDVGQETSALLAGCDGAGAVASFLGIVRSNHAAPISALTLEHYPAMTQTALEEMATLAQTRFALLGCTVIHRFGTLAVHEPIVLVLTAATHRRTALDGCAFLIDWLKTEAPFWKKEHFLDGSAAWVDAKDADRQATQAWRPG